MPLEQEGWTIVKCEMHLFISLTHKNETNKLLLLRVLWTIQAFHKET